MLADLSLVGCYNMSTVPETRRAALLLDSAKKNLRDMAFFGLTEHQRQTQIGRASCRDSVKISVVAVSLKKKIDQLL